MGRVRSHQNGAEKMFIPDSMIFVFSFSSNQGEKLIHGKQTDRQKQNIESWHKRRTRQFAIPRRTRGSGDRPRKEKPIRSSWIDPFATTDKCEQATFFGPRQPASDERRMGLRYVFISMLGALLDESDAFVKRIKVQVLGSMNVKKKRKPCRLILI
jgi:hypothetical protein